MEMWTPYTRAERDRRWNAVRQGAAGAGLDCIFVPLGNGVDGRYLTGFRAASVVIPTDGRPPIVVTDPFTQRGAVNPWVPEPRRADGGGWGQAMARALVDLSLERARIGVAGLRGGRLAHVRAPEGVVNHSPYAEVVRQLPSAIFEDATDVVGSVRHVKSAEEIDCLRHAVEIAEAGIDVMIAEARPGVELGPVYARVMERMLELGSEYYPLAIAADPAGTPSPVRYTNPPPRKQLRPNALITPEVSAVWGAQLAEEYQPILLGPIPDEWRPVIDLQQEVYQAGLKLMKPGTAFGDLIDFVNSFGERARLKTAIAMYGRSLGDDGPRLSPGMTSEGVRDLAIQRGSAWVWRPYAMTSDERTGFSWGGVVVITETGGKALSRRTHRLVSTG
jgi:Xaa-Pro aminopeptidase